MATSNDESFFVKFLEWDSNLFNKKIGSLNLDRIQSLITIQEACVSYDLVYIFIKQSSHYHPDFNSLFQVDNVIFHKVVGSLNRDMDLNIKPIPIHFKPQVAELAYSAGEFSRFKQDPHFNKVEFHKLYDVWLGKSFSEQGNEIIGYFLDNLIAGFISFSFTGGKNLKIELLALSSKFQKQGIGKKLLEFTENFAYENACDTIEVVTQANNLEAVKFYTRNGYHIIQSYKIIHYWNII